MKRTGLVFDDRYLRHLTGPLHPESPERLRAALRGLEEAGLMSDLVRVPARPAPQHWIEAVHHIDYIMRFEEACLLGFDEFETPDNAICADTYEAATVAVGGVLEACRLVMAGEIDNAFCAVRPPGHHAELNQPMGFCYFNNVAIAARYLQREFGVGRVGIVDFDVHHGNGTEHLFNEDPTVFYYSIHEHPTFAFPGTGRDFDKGIGPGFGFTLNTPMLPGSGDKEYREAMERDLLPAFSAFEPEFILVSTGFDAHADDDMSGINLTAEGFVWIMETIADLAERHAGGRLVSVLEGGYSIERLPALIRDHVRVLLGT
jgi:acetoin utilization deacetylase AcuC-like enzyme